MSDMEQRIAMLGEMRQYMVTRNKGLWAELLVRMISEAEAILEDDDDSDYEYSEDEGDAIEEEDPIVLIDDRGLQRLY